MSAREIDDLLLHIRGLVLVREILRQRGATPAELEAHTAELDRLKDRLAELAVSGNRRRLGHKRGAAASQPPRPSSSRSDECYEDFIGSRYTSSIPAAPPTAVNRNETEEVKSGRTPPSIPIWGEGFQEPPAEIVPPSRMPSTLESRPR